MATPPTRRVSAFIQISLDGYFTDLHGDMSFAHKPPDDTEWNQFVAGNASGPSVLLFGRTTYDMMASWWPTPAAAQAMPEVAAQMNATSKVVFSRTMTTAAWSNTTVASDLLGAVRKMKTETGPDMVILGSGTIITQLADAGLLDALQVVLNPIALGSGKSLFAGLTKRFTPTLEKSRVFRNGSVVLWYTS
jgi:dihydrofolate reductase